MYRLLTAFASLAFVSLSGPAMAASGYYDQYGYQAPNKYRPAGKPFGEAAKQKKKSPKFVDEQNYEPAKKKKAANVQASEPSYAGKELTGGPRPFIGAIAPPKVSFPNSYGAGKIVIDTARRKLYYVLSSSQAYRYPISVGRDGFTWTGTQKVSKVVNWPDWRPPAEMLERKPNLPELMTGGIRNPLGAKALYLGNTLYRIHGTNDAKSIGYAASSGCFRMLNGHVVHLAQMAGIGTTVHVVNKLPSKIANAE